MLYCNKCGAEEGETDGLREWRGMNVCTPCLHETPTYAASLEADVATLRTERDAAIRERDEARAKLANVGVPLVLKEVVDGLDRDAAGLAVAAFLRQLGQRGAVGFVGGKGM